MSSAFAAALSPLARQRGIRASLVVEEREGLVVDSIVHVGVDADAIAALATLLYRHTRDAAKAAGVGQTTFLQLEAERGNLCVAGVGELLLVALTETGVNIGRLRVDMLRAAEGLV